MVVVLFQMVEEQEVLVVVEMVVPLVQIILKCGMVKIMVLMDNQILEVEVEALIQNQMMDMKEALVL